MTELSQYIFAFVLGLCAQYSISYFKTKGANQAHKSDKGELTRIIKEVEHKFNANIELVKVKLDNTNHFLKDLKNDEKNSLLSLHYKLFKYYHFLTDTTSFSLEDNKAINTNFQQRSDLFDELLMEYQNLKIFIPDEHFNILEMYQLCIDETFVFIDKRTEFLFEMQNLNTVNDKNSEVYYNEFKILDEEFDTIVSDFINTIGPKLNDFTDSIRLYVKEKQFD